MYLPDSRTLAFSAFILLLGGYGLTALNPSPQSIHTYTLTWPLQLIQPGEWVAGYVLNWTTPDSIRILQVDVWLGKPYDILWEGDAFLLTAEIPDPWHPQVDEVIVHYQFDSHAPSPLTHFRVIDLRPGFHVEEGETLYVYRLFNSFDDKPTNSGDGWIRLYYIYV